MSSSSTRRITSSAPSDQLTEAVDQFLADRRQLFTKLQRTKADGEQRIAKLLDEVAEAEKALAESEHSQLKRALAEAKQELETARLNHDTRCASIKTEMYKCIPDEILERIESTKRAINFKMDSLRMLPVPQIGTLSRDSAAGRRELERVAAIMQERDRRMRRLAELGQRLQNIRYSTDDIGAALEDIVRESVQLEMPN